MSVGEGWAFRVVTCAHGAKCQHPDALALSPSHSIEMTRDATCSGEKQQPHVNDLAFGMHIEARCEEALQ
jgi:hypothetical protein